MSKIDTDTTEPHGTQNILTKTPNPNPTQERNRNNKNAQNVVTRSKLRSQNKQEKYRKTNTLQKTSTTLKKKLSKAKEVWRNSS